MVRLNLAILCRVFCLLTHVAVKDGSSRLTRWPVSQNATPPNSVLMNRKRDVTDSAIFHSMLSKIRQISADHI